MQKRVENDNSCIEWRRGWPRNMRFARRWLAI